MLISIIVAMGRNRVIGVDGGMPWHLPAELARFRRITMGKPIVMGRSTHESIGRPLPGRDNIVLTRDHTFRAEGCKVVYTMEGALAAAGEREEVMIIGGASVYAQALPMVGRLYLTYIQHEFQGDTFFPEFTLDDWHEVESSERAEDENNPYACTFVIYDRRNGTAR